MLMNIQLSPYLNFNGNCEEAMNFYKSVFGGELQISRFKDFAGPDMPTPEGYEDKVMHSTLTSEGLSFMASDGAPGQSVTFGNSVQVSVAGDDETRLKAIFDGLSQGGSVTMPMAKQVWGDQFGMLTDKYGIHWMVDISPAKAPDAQA